MSQVSKRNHIPRSLLSLEGSSAGDDNQMIFFKLHSSKYMKKRKKHPLISHHIQVRERIRIMLHLQSFEFLISGFDDRLRFWSKWAYLSHWSSALNRRWRPIREILVLESENTWVRFVQEAFAHRVSVRKSRWTRITNPKKSIQKSILNYCGVLLSILSSISIQISIHLGEISGFTCNSTVLKNETQNSEVHLHVKYRFTFIIFR